jgi:hypothetical protein
LHAVSALDPDAVLAAHPMARPVLGSRALARMAFRMALTADVKQRETDGNRLGGRTGDGRHSASLRPLPRVTLDPLMLSVEERAALLVGTPVGWETKWELNILQAQYAAAAGRMRSAGRNAVVPPFDVGRIGVAPFRGPSRTRRVSRPRQLPGRDGEGAGEDGKGGDLPPNLLFALAVAGMESAKESLASRWTSSGC